MSETREEILNTWWMDLEREPAPEEETGEAEAAAQEAPAYTVTFTNKEYMAIFSALIDAQIQLKSAARDERRGLLPQQWAAEALAKVDHAQQVIERVPAGPRKVL
ncbi:MAG: hypothetical protein JO345_12025 [Streptosporangiaceae bacterium]|nr:hypothetical protein [Streptosporangiaceae bacterium]